MKKPFLALSLFFCALNVSPAMYAMQADSSIADHKKVKAPADPAQTASIAAFIGNAGELLGTVLLIYAIVGTASIAVPLCILLIAFGGITGLAAGFYTMRHSRNRLKYRRRGIFSVMFSILVLTPLLLMLLLYLLLGGDG